MDAPAPDDSPAVDGAADSPEVDPPSPLDAAPDAPSDTSPPPCGALDQPCCTASPACASSLLCRDGRCAACPSGLTLCGDACLDLRADASHCGACGSACPAGFVCTSGACACPAALTRCGDACVDTLSAAAHCGACGRSCDGALPGATARCESARCVIVSCDAGRADCDRDPANGCETPLASAVTDCGACGRACVPPPGLGVSCQEGRCVVGDVCAAGLADCTAEPGCETSTARDALNCGACGHACSTRRATSRCEAGRCALACEAGYADCDGDPDTGCEAALATEVAHCGACGARCALPHATAACAAGRCAVASCEAGYADCDGDPSNGCEVDVRADVAHCGRCRNACPPPAGGDATCAAGSCGQACPAGRAPCAGACVDLAADVAHCGACGARCAFPHATAACRAGACSLGACEAGWGDCDGLAGNGCETSLTVNGHCGACGVRCPDATNASGACVAGRCGLACADNYGDCDGQVGTGCEVRLTFNPQHCGACGRACPTYRNAFPTCTSAPSCSYSCMTGYAECDRDPATGCEVDVARDPLNCGVCGNRCVGPPTATLACSNRCVVAACASGRADCDASPLSGCEVDTQGDASNCGACGRACPAVAGANRVAACLAGACGGRCARGFFDCDGDPSNGCEVDGRSDPARCGACARACPAGRDCVAGECALPAPAPLPAPLSHHAALLARDGHVYVFGGGRTERYDIAANAWTTRAPMPAPLRGPGAALLPDGRVLVAGGYDTALARALDRAWYYDPASDAWRDAPPMSDRREGNHAVSAPDGTVWVVGNGERSSGIEVFDPTTERWAARSVPGTFQYTAVQFVAGALFSWGGDFPAVRRYAPAADAWDSLDASLSPIRRVATAKDAADRVYVVGGAAPSGAPPLGATEFVFDPTSWRLTPIAPLPFARRYAAAVALPDGRILVIGGQRVSDGAPTASVTAYSPASDAWR